MMSGGADGAIENGLESLKDGGAAFRARGHGGESKVDGSSARADVRGEVPVRSSGGGGGTCHASSGEVGEGGGEGAPEGAATAGAATRFVGRTAKYVPSLSRTRQRLASRLNFDSTPSRPFKSSRVVRPVIVTWSPGDSTAPRKYWTSAPKHTHEKSVVHAGMPCTSARPSIRLALEA